LRILDLFSGLGGWSAAFKDRGHEVVRIERNYRFGADYCRDIGALESLDQFGRFDVILASPPCENFSVASIHAHWQGHVPDESAQRSLELVRHTIKLIEDAKPRFWILENPRGMLRKLIGKPNATVAYCQYGLSIMKPTDLWGILPPSFKPRCCKGGNPDHEAAPRGKTEALGLQKIASTPERAKVPYQLSLEVCLACERDL